jgi:Fe-S cluster assembly protein SufD
MNAVTLARLREALPHDDPARTAALAAFLAAGFPQRGTEDWRYTALDHLDAVDLHAPQTLAALPLPDHPGSVLHFVNGRALPDNPSLPHVTHLALARAALGRVADGRALDQLNRALWRDGVALTVPAQQRNTPLFIVHDATEAGAMIHLRHLVVLEAGAEAILVEHDRGLPGTPYWVNTVCEIALGEGARLTHVRVVGESDAATHTALVAVEQSRDSVYRGVTLTLGGRVVRQDYAAALCGRDAQCAIDGVFIAQGRRHFDHQVRIHHHATHTTSRQTWRGIADGRGRGIFDSRVVVQPGAQQADARQSSRNLLLSADAEIDVKPQLEIWTDDVQCSHGATVGRLDADALFYLQSRGIAAAEARRLLLEGFVDEALDSVRAAGLMNWLAALLRAALPATREERST